MTYGQYKIEGDRSRFKKIIRGQIKRDLKKYITNGEMIGRKGKDTVSIPLPQIQLPRFTYGHKDMGGIGQGPGEEGDSLGGEPQPGEEGEAGDQPGDHILEVEVSIEELADILGEELELPKIEPRGEDKLQTIKERYTSIRKTGPESLRHLKRTLKQALKRQIALGSYDPKNPRLIPIREDKRYRSWKETYLPESKALVVYMMDVSGSMGEEQKDIVRTESFWLDAWIQKHYDNIETRYIVHDATAEIVDRETFFHTRESGGTLISSAYRLCGKLIEEEFNPVDWNIYPFHFSDGDNWSKDDTDLCLRLLYDKLLPASNVFCYGQVSSPYGTGRFIKDLEDITSDPGIDNLVLSQIIDREGIVESIKDFLGTGK